MKKMCVSAARLTAEVVKVSSAASSDAARGAAEVGVWSQTAPLRLEAVLHRWKNLRNNANERMRIL